MIYGTFRPMFHGTDTLPGCWCPMVEVSFSDSRYPALPNVVATNLTALIDTGADFCRIDTELAKRTRLTAHNKLPSISAGGTNIVDVFRGQIILGDGTILDVDLCEAPLRSAGCQYDFLLGMEALRFFDLTISRKENRITLQFVGA